MAEYVDNPEATAAAFTEDGFFRTGDLGMTHAGGAFTFLSRMGDVLRLGGFLVNPQEIEDYVQGHAAVDGCQVVGADGDRGTVPVAFVIPAAGTRFSESDIAAHCRKGLAKYKVPARIVAVDAFPVTTGPNGVKIQRAKLRDRAQALLADRAAS
jgi:fatty-acyl-CoA synthase